MKYWTLLNKGYNSSHIFGHGVHFATEPSDSSDSDASGASGGGSGEGGEPTIDELREALAKAQGERDAAIIRADKNKRSLDTALKDLSAEKKKNRESLSADQIAAAEKQELLDRIAELETQTRTSGYTKRLMGLGIAEDKASSLASLLPPFAEEDNADAFFTGLAEFIAGATKTAGEEAVQKLIKDNHIDISGGSGRKETNIAVERAKALASGRTAVSTDILKNYM